MKYKKQKYQRVLAIAPSHRGFAFALFDGIFLGDWGGKVFSGDLNTSCLAETKQLIIKYRPDVLAFEDFTDSKRGERVRKLAHGLQDLGKQHKVDVKRFTRDRVNKAFFETGEGTKYQLAELVAKEFPGELGHRLPPKRQPWTSEDYRMAMFDAVALGLMVRDS
jgi:hypothetical protein